MGTKPGIGRFLAAGRLPVVVGALVCGGCGAQPHETKIVYGDVYVGKERVEQGIVRFVPIEGTAGPASFSHITEGTYRIEVRGGVPLGWHRVEVDARKNTGRVLPATGKSLLSEVPRPELQRIAPPQYFSKDSPLKVEVRADSDGRIDIRIPSP